MTAEEVVAIVNSARSDVPDPRLDEVLDGSRARWFGIARKRYGATREDAENAVQIALLKLLAGDRVEHLRDVAKFEAWARSVFVNAFLDLARDARRWSTRRVYLDTRGADTDRVLRERLPADEPSPEETALARERLRIAVRCIEKRFRRTLRAELGEGSLE